MYFPEGLEDTALNVKQKGMELFVFFKFKKQLNNAWVLKKSYRFL